LIETAYRWFTIRPFLNVGKETLNSSMFCRDVFFKVSIL